MQEAKESKRLKGIKGDPRTFHGASKREAWNRLESGLSYNKANHARFELVHRYPWESSFKISTSSLNPSTPASLVQLLHSGLQFLLAGLGRHLCKDDPISKRAIRKARFSSRDYIFSSMTFIIEWILQDRSAQFEWKWLLGREKRREIGAGSTINLYGPFTHMILRRCLDFLRRVSAALA